MSKCEELRQAAEKVIEAEDECTASSGVEQSVAALASLTNAIKGLRAVLAEQ